LTEICWSVLPQSYQVGQAAVRCLIFAILRGIVLSYLIINHPIEHFGQLRVCDQIRPQ
jgi:hypothetical protein